MKQHDIIRYIGNVITQPQADIGLELRLAIVNTCRLVDSHIWIPHRASYATYIIQQAKRIGAAP